MPKKWIEIGSLKVDSHLLESRMVARCRLEECGSACCGHGVHVDLADATRIVQEADVVKPHLPPDRHDVDNWFDGDVGEDSDYPTGLRVGTQVIEDKGHPAGTRCMFLRPDNLCALQVAAVANGRHPWDMKPFYCALFPIIILGNTVLLDDDNEVYLLGGTCQRAETVSSPLYIVFKDELTLALGEKGYAQLSALAQSSIEERLK
jgi:hypothetical protein